MLAVLIFAKPDPERHLRDLPPGEAFSYSCTAVDLVTLSRLRVQPCADRGPTGGRSPDERLRLHQHSAGAAPQARLEEGAETMGVLFPQTDAG